MAKLHLLTKSASTVVYALNFLISALILGIFSYYLAVLSRRDGAVIPNWERAVEGMSGAAVIYTAFAVLMTCFFGGITFLAFLGLVLDICFCGAMIAIAVMTRDATNSCAPRNDSPIGPGESLSCRLQQVVFAVAIIGAVLFLIAAALQVALTRSHKREKRYGPGPSNNYTSGSGSTKRKPWQRKKKAKGTDAEMGAFGSDALANGHDGQAHTDAPAPDTTYGGPNTKYAGTEPATAGRYGTSKPAGPEPHAVYGNQPTGPTGTGYDNQQMGSGYYTGPTGTMASGTTAGYSEMDASHTGGAHDPQVLHDPNPYAEVHQGGYVHTQPETAYAR